MIALSVMTYLPFSLHGDSSLLVHGSTPVKLNIPSTFETPPVPSTIFFMIPDNDDFMQCMASKKLMVKPSTSMSHN